MHKRLLHLAHDPANRPQIEIRLVQPMKHGVYHFKCISSNLGLPVIPLHSSSDENTAESFQPYAPGEDSVQSSSKILPPPAFGSSPNLEALALEENDSVDLEEERSVHASLTALLAEVGLNIQEAHAFSTTDGYSLDVFVVEGWPYEETEKLKETLEKEVLKIERHERSSQQSISSVDE
ncbi:ACT-like tyrosine kinase family protein, partial [Trifolium pratense]